MLCGPGTRPVVMSVQDELICVCLLMPHCMFSVQLFYLKWLSFVGAVAQWVELVDW